MDLIKHVSHQGTTHILYGYTLFSGREVVGYLLKTCTYSVCDFGHWISLELAETFHVDKFFPI